MAGGRESEAFWVRLDEDARKGLWEFIRLELSRLGHTVLYRLPSCKEACDDLTQLLPS